jgi:type I restriction enzyme S subunit
MINKKKVIEIRFKGFSGEWEKKKLGKIYDFQYGKFNNNPSDGGIYNVYGANGIIGTYSFFNAENSIIIGHMGEYAGSVLWGEGKHFVTYNGIISTPKNSKFYPKYIYYLLNKLNIRKMCGGSGQPFLSYGTLKKLNISYPRNIQEQTKISDYFQKLDKLIEQKEKKQQKLKQLKKAMLNKIFPKNGEKIPEIRFKGFSGEWEEKKLGEIGEIVTGSTPSTQEPLYYSINGIPWVTPTDISKNITFYTARYLSSKGQEVARIVPKNTILVTCIASIGKNTLLGSIGSFNQQINGLIPNKNENNSYFLFIESIFWSNKMKKIAASGTMQIVNKKEFSKLRTFLPKLQEQTKIGNYFQKLDKLIELQKKELEKLKQLKKSLLSKMFI